MPTAKTDMPRWGRVNDLPEEEQANAIRDWVESGVPPISLPEPEETLISDLLAEFNPADPEE